MLQIYIFIIKSQVFLKKNCTIVNKLRFLLITFDEDEKWYSYMHKVCFKST